MVGQQQILSETEKRKSSVSTLLSNVQTDEMGEDTLLVSGEGAKEGRGWGLLLFIIFHTFTSIQRFGFLTHVPSLLLLKLHTHAAQHIHSEILPFLCVPYILFVL